MEVAEEIAVTNQAMLSQKHLRFRVMIQPVPNPTEKQNTGRAAFEGMFNDLRTYIMRNVAGGFGGTKGEETGVGWASAHHYGLELLQTSVV
jgi:hypothetical protein